MAEVMYRHEVPFGHRLQRHKGKCRFPHGHNYLFDITVRGPVDAETGMVVDFSEVKRIAREFFDQFDHAFVLEQSDPLKNMMVEEWHGRDTPVKLVIIDAPPTAENLAILVREAFRVQGLYTTVTCWEQRDCSATSSSSTTGDRLPKIVGTL